MSILHAPSTNDIKASRLSAFLDYVEAHSDHMLSAATPTQSYQNLHQYSVQNAGKFHSLAWDFCGVLGDKGARALTNETSILDAAFFPDAKISYAENMLKAVAVMPNEPAIISRIAGRDKDQIISWQALYDAVSRWQQLLEQCGIKEGDRLSTYLPHIPEAYIIHIAAANIGAIFSSVGTEMGSEATADRFKQIKPKLLIAVDGYTHITAKGERAEERLSTVKDLQDQVQSLETTIIIPHLDQSPDLSVLNNAKLSSDLLNNIQPQTIEFIRRAFDHPLAILFSSGSTGTPKCFVHGTGNIILKHAIEHQFQNDTRAGDREFYHTTTSWMMFNWLASALAQSATILIYDGNPAYPAADAQLRFAAQYNCAHLGTAAGVIQDLWRANNVRIAPEAITHLRAISYTASVLSPEGYDYINQNIKKDLSINGICGGTDFVGCYAMGNPFMPTIAGQLKGPVLGMDIDTWDDEARPVTADEIGELVVKTPFISRPLYFWDDEKTEQCPHGERFTQSYFTHYTNITPPIWRHGDAVKLLSNGQLIVTGRSDSTLNQNGVRIGSQVLYDALDNPALKDAITESIAVNFKDAEGGDHSALFIVKSGETERDALIASVKAIISDKVGRLCVPHEIQIVPYILKTPNGKKVEKPTQQALAGEAISTPETYGKDPESGAYKTALYEKLGENIRQNPKYGFTKAQAGL